MNRFTLCHRQFLRPCLATTGGHHIFEAEQRLKDRRAGGVSLEIEVMDERIERDALMGIRTRAHLPDPLEELVERGGSR